ncbi:MAG: capsule assembly Wzi family protein [Halomonadaceae bacterium]|nr:MAG: capsule assembly Wzi family protein [Halomonadaceae bacterium]
MVRLTTLLFLCLLVPALGVAEPYLASESRQVRHDVQTLADAGALNRPTTTWPLPTGALAELRQLSIEDQPGYVLLARERVLAAADAQGAGIRLRASENPSPRTHFGDQAINNAEARVTYGFSGERFGGRLQGNLTDDRQQGTDLTLDGSYGAVRLGNWLLSAGAQDRWWGPGWEGSLILGDNPRPVPAIALERNDPRPSELPVLRWLGPWNLTSFFGQLESNRDDAARPKFFGFRLVFQPLEGLEVGLSRTAQWGGEGRPENLSSLWATLVGQSNRGDRNDLLGGDANQFGGYDFRWRSPFGDNAPYAIYGQLIGIDEAGGTPYQFIGLAGTEYWRPVGHGLLRLNLEVADTEVEFYSDNPRGSRAYLHSFYTDGYRHRGRVMGHTLDGNGRMISLGAQYSQSDGGYWHGLLRHTEQNRNGGDNRATGVEEQAKIIGAELTHSLPWQQHRVSLTLGADFVNEDIQGRDTIGRISASYSYQF